MTYLDFIRSNKRLALFGPMLTFHSAFGQTFFISLFVPYILTEFSLTNTGFGLIYSGSTLASAGLLMLTGQLIDRHDLKWYSASVAIGLGISALLMSLSFSLWILAPALIGMRLFGQGLAFHTAQATMARYFEALRGKALSISTLGMPLAEAVLPSLFAFLIVVAGWRNSWLIVGGLSIFFLLPVLILLLRTLETHPANLTAGKDGFKDEEIHWNRRKVLNDIRFFFILPATLLTPFMLTGLFLFQLTLAGSKGWTVETIAAAFIAFAAGKVIFSLLVGPLIDRYSAKKSFHGY
jgi:MFS family permease